MRYNLKQRTIVLLLIATLAFGWTPTGASEGPSGLVVTELSSPDLTEDDLVTSLMGPGVELVPGSIVLTGAENAFGLFSGGSDTIGFADGLIMGSGRASNILGPNEWAGKTTVFGTPGDIMLNGLAGHQTHDAAVLEFQIEVGSSGRIGFTYVFGSEEYNEWVGSQYNDVFAFWVNGQNCALTPDGRPVSVNTINNGKPHIPATNPDLYINNDPHWADSSGETVAEEDLLFTEVDGFTVGLHCIAEVNAGLNTFKLAIADASDARLDSWVFIQSESLMMQRPAGHGLATAVWTDGEIRSEGADQRGSGTNRSATEIIGQPGGPVYAIGVEESVHVMLDETVGRVEASVDFARVELMGGLVVLEGLSHHAFVAWDSQDASPTAAGSTFGLAAATVAGLPVHLGWEGENITIDLPGGGRLVLFDTVAADHPYRIDHSGRLLHLVASSSEGAEESILGEISLAAGLEPPGLPLLEPRP